MRMFNVQRVTYREQLFHTRLHKSSSVTILQHMSRSFVVAVYLQTEQIALYFLQLANWPFFIVQTSKSALLQKPFCAL